MSKRANPSRCRREHPSCFGAATAYAGSRIDYIWRACPAAGFDIVLVDHVTGAPTTVPHAAGRLIDFAMVVPVGAGGQRRVYHQGLAAGQYLTLGGSSGTDSGWIASTAIDVTLGASMPTGRYTAHIPHSATKLPRHSRPNSPQWATGTARRIGSAAHPLLHRRYCANLNSGLQSPLDETRGAQHTARQGSDGGTWNGT
ncbi:hypothetical protein KL86APRO_10012 [uncultured Alphaproteobacteria bacterium]|uniref:Uncharacterized protein n=1 Tax=uncultured Alphaproteobacteria bacterium TaxID=91750 RepID=A0A212ITK7_9PROT|nr:hypothetical protein KL86APRO_10012 [uncultured Alphaproteobacteria bacterium]